VPRARAGETRASMPSLARGIAILAVLVGWALFAAPVAGAPLEAAPEVTPPKLPPVPAAPQPPAPPAPVGGAPPSVPEVKAPEGVRPVPSPPDLPVPVSPTRSDKAAGSGSGGTTPGETRPGGSGLTGEAAPAPAPGARPRPASGGAGSGAGRAQTVRRAAVANAREGAPSLEEGMVAPLRRWVAFVWPAIALGPIERALALPLVLPLALRPASWDEAISDAASRFAPVLSTLTGAVGSEAAERSVPAQKYRAPGSAPDGGLIGHGGGMSLLVLLITIVATLIGVVALARLTVGEDLFSRRWLH